ncbi:hypothetical protein NUW54_g938 [Trametes sanguinea]|uniref:Uncharacterized protein n=2 Tax=Trametes sanguinea TaxID=158606 RepID=A0ACC1Q7I3_9APHY|nr:hypothetical protein NUW54_g1020 [Trametes sanguinea]KAJ3015853.1 hypothetical protein NUW54_g938 [Trametes sanguinea]
MEETSGRAHLRNLGTGTMMGNDILCRIANLSSPSPPSSYYPPPPTLLQPAQVSAANSTAANTTAPIAAASHKCSACGKVGHITAAAPNLPASTTSMGSNQASNTPLSTSSSYEDFFSTFLDSPYHTCHVIHVTTALSSAGKDICLSDHSLDTQILCLRPLHFVPLLLPFLNEQSHLSNLPVNDRCTAVELIGDRVR